MTQPHRKVTYAAALAGVILLAACGSGSDDDEARKPESTQRSTSTVEETTTTTQPAVGPPEWVDVVRDIYQRNVDLLADPNPDQVNSLYAGTCECWDKHSRLVEALATDGHHIEGQPTSVLFVKHEQTDEAGFVDLTAKLKANPLRELDTNGNLVEEYPAPAEAGCVALTLLADGSDGAYRIHTLQPLTGCPPGS